MSVDSRLASIPDHLLAWYDVNARALPWRAPPGSPARASDPDWPYRVWLSEVMLQQTTVAAVKPYFRAFTARWPTVTALAAADEAEVMAAWAGLGYYARARNLIACARAVAADHDGRFPATEAELRTLPGLGAYTAAAVAAIAFGEQAVVVDANVERVTARLFAIDEPLPAARAAIRAAAAGITPERRAGDFAQAMMDLGSTICTPRNPSCILCPLRAGCTGAATGDPGQYPAKAPKKAKPVRQGTAFWLERDREVLLVRRPDRGMLGGMRALPTGPWQSEAPDLADAPVLADWSPVGRLTHVFTHFALDMTVVRARVGATAPPDDGEWWPIDRLADAGLPTLFTRAADLAIAAPAAEAPNSPDRTRS